MSWRERDYTWFSESSGAALRDWRSLLPPPGATGLLVAHLTGFIIALLLRHGVSENAAESIALTNELNAWTVFTHPIATTNGLMLSCILCGVWSLAGRIEDLLGMRRMLALYAGGNVLAGLAFVVIARFWPINASASLSEPVGAVAAWVVTIWTLLPFENVGLFGRFFSLRSVGLTCTAIVATLTVMQYGPGATAWLTAAFVGGAVAPVIDVAYTLVARRRQRAESAPSRPTRSERRSEPARRTNPAPEPESQLPEIDDLLAKISRAGIDSLTASERARLEAARKARLERDGAA
jgi:membrane associated rhomboid family serine protease